MNTLLEKVYIMAGGLAVGWVFAQYRFGFSENALLIDSHISDLESFSEAVSDYWFSDSTNSNDQVVAAARVKSLHVPISVFYGQAKSLLVRSREYEVLQLRLFKVAMGGSFETAAKEQELEVALEASNLVAEIRLLLRLARKDQFSVVKKVQIFMRNRFNCFAQ